MTDQPIAYPWQGTCDACNRSRSAGFLSLIPREDPAPPYRYCSDQVECMEAADLVKRQPRA